MPESLCEHGLRVLDLLQDIQFPKLNGDSRIDGTVDYCWRNRFETITELALRMTVLLQDVEDNLGTFSNGLSTDVNPADESSNFN